MSKSTPRVDVEEPTHGSLVLPSVMIDSYSLELREGDALIGDQASQTAFREVLDEWRKRLHGRGRDPFGRTKTEALSKSQIDRAAAGTDPLATHTVDLAVDEFSHRLAKVITVFLEQPVWRGVERIIVGGGFKQSEIGEHTIHVTERLLQESGIELELRPLHHEADDGGLIGWVHLAPPALLKGHDAILAVDIGGTNVRCGLVKIGAEMAKARVIERRKWRHADDDPGRRDLVEGIVYMLREMMSHAKKKEIRLAPFIGVGCPGLIRSDGSISRGAQNLPGDWHSASFHLPRRLHENIPKIGGEESVVLMHNDAVVQGLSELPFITEARRWAVLTIGTGLGNASYTNRR